MLYLRPSRLLPELPLAKGDGRYACLWGSQKHQWATSLFYTHPVLEWCRYSRFPVSPFSVFPLEAGVPRFHIRQRKLCYQNQFFTLPLSDIPIGYNSPLWPVPRREPAYCRARPLGL